MAMVIFVIGVCRGGCMYMLEEPKTRVDISKEPKRWDVHVEFGEKLKRPDHPLNFVYRHYKKYGHLPDKEEILERLGETGRKRITNKLRKDLKENVDVYILIDGERLPVQVPYNYKAHLTKINHYNGLPMLKQEYNELCKTSDKAKKIIRRVENSISKAGKGKVSLVTEMAVDKEKLGRILKELKIPTDVKPKHFLNLITKVEGITPHKLVYVLDEMGYKVPSLQSTMEHYIRKMYNETGLLPSINGLRVFGIPVDTILNAWRNVHKELGLPRDYKDAYEKVLSSALAKTAHHAEIYGIVGAKRR